MYRRNNLARYTTSGKQYSYHSTTLDTNIIKTETHLIRLYRNYYDFDVYVN